MGDARSYAAALVEEDLGLPLGRLRGDRVPGEMADLAAGFLRGAAGTMTSRPLLEDAVVRLSEELKREALEEAGHYARKARWPDARPFAACVTHDVDNVERPLRHIWQRRDRFSTGGLVLALLRIRSLYNNIGYVEGVERSRGVRSTFYLLSSAYDLKGLRGEVARLRNSGWEVGLHGDFGTHDSKEKMEEAVRKFEGALGFRPEGAREHYLQFDFARTWGIMEGAGLSYDTTVGNRDSLGFRAGLCTPFHPPGADWEPMKILELPLVLMDTTLWGYLKLSEADGIRRAKEMAETVAGLGGLFTLLWHQESVRMKGGRQFVPLLDHLEGLGCYFATATGMAQWWEARRAPLVLEGDVYTLRGAPSGLVVEFEAREGLKPRVRGGTIERLQGGTVARVTSAEFELRFE